MPELPEVESLVQSLRPFVLGQKITRIEVRWPKLVSGRGNVRKASKQKTVEFITSLEGERIGTIGRRAKNLLFHLESGKVLLVHLKMTGQLVWRGAEGKASGGHPIELSEGPLPHQHTHVIFTLGNGTLYYNDTRKFGYLLYFSDQETLERTEHFKGVGVEPLGPEFTLNYFQDALQNRSGNVKTVLLNQAVVVGLGNIYADEACFAAAIRPTRKASSLNAHEVKKLHAVIPPMLRRAVTLGGSSIANYLLADGSRGNYAREHKVYGRGGEPCAQCNRPLTRCRIQSRTTVYCNYCQA